jgi:hypothetical protein
MVKFDWVVKKSKVKVGPNYHAVTCGARLIGVIAD